MKEEIKGIEINVLGMVLILLYFQLFPNNDKESFKTVLWYYIEEHLREIVLKN